MAKDIMSAIPVIGGLFDDSDEQAMAELAKNRKLYENIQLPNLMWEDYAPELFQTESAQYELTQEDPLLKSAQLSALQKMAGLAESGLSDIDAAGFQRARSMGARDARAGTEAAIANAAARGAGGSGMEFAMREMANQGGAERAQQAALEQAAASARQRALYQQAYGDMLGNVRGQDLGARQANTDIINRFNQANTAQRNETAVNNTQTKNSAQQYNLEGRRDTKQQNFTNEMARAGGISGATKDIAGGYAAQNAARTADRNTWTQIGASALTGMPVGGAPKKPKANSAGQSYNDYYNMA